MSTQYVRESVQSRLFPFRQAIEELNCRREDGFNNFTNEEPAIERLLNALDFILNTDVQQPGEFFDFMKCALESLPRQALSHAPLEQVLARNSNAVASPQPIQHAASLTASATAASDRTLENFRLWLIFSLNMTGSLKVALHQTLPMRDVLSCFVRSDSILFMDTFIDEFLGSLAVLHNPPTGEGQTTFRLDASALQLFQERSIVVHVQKKSASHTTRLVRRPTKCKSTETGSPTTTISGKADSFAEGRQGTATGGSNASSTVSRRRSTLATVPPVTYHEGACQTDESLLRPFVEQLATTGSVVGVATTSTSSTSSGAVSSSSKVDAETNTDHPSPLMSFQELMEAQAGIDKFRAEQRAIFEKLREQQLAVEEQEREHKERMELVVSTIRQLKSMYNELFMRSLEAQDKLEYLTEADVDHRIVEIFQLLRGASMPPAASPQSPVTPTVAKSAADTSRVTSRPSSTAVVNQPQPQSTTSASTAVAPQKPTKASSYSDPTVATPASAQTTTTSATVAAGATGTAAATKVASAASTTTVAHASSSIIDSRALDDHPTVPSASQAMIPVDHTRLVTVEPTELERVQQLSIQANRCAGCANPFAESDDKNLVLKVVQKAGETLRLQKPRRCHYCARLFCHRCHMNKMTTLPFRVLQRWDFAPQHVCNRDYEFLSKNADKAFYYLPSLPQELQSRPNVQQAAFLRKRLLLLAKIVVQCMHEKSAAFSPFLHSHYAQKEHFYSLVDFTRLRAGEGNRLLNTPLNAVTAVGNYVAHGGPLGSATAPGALPATEELVSYLTGVYTKMTQHVHECRQCTARASMRCALCSDPSPVYVVDDDMAQCQQCLQVFHGSCWEVAGCKCTVCAKRT